MHLLFLIPDLRRSAWLRARLYLRRHGVGTHVLGRHRLWTTEVFGGVLDMMRQCALARSLGADAVLATESGRDTYGAWGIGGLPFVAWSERRRDDVCIIPDVYSHLADEVAGEVVVYQQNPNQVRNDFTHTRRDLRLWTCSPLMSEHCRRAFSGKEPTLVPTIIDPRVFPFIPQEQREPGRLAALPRKNAMAFIQAAYGCYRDGGGRYWKLDLIDGLSLREYAVRLQAPQALLPATDVEGYGLPAMEAMAGGVVVAGKNAGGASFYMREGETALIANTPESAAAALRAIEDPALRQRLSAAAYEHVRQFFPDAEPTRFWEGYLAELQQA